MLYRQSDFQLALDQSGPMSLLLTYRPSASILNLENSDCALTSAIKSASFLVGLLYVPFNLADVLSGFILLASPIAHGRAFSVLRIADIRRLAKMFRATLQYALRGAYYYHYPPGGDASP